MWGWRTAVRERFRLWRQPPPERRSAGHPRASFARLDPTGRRDRTTRRTTLSVSLYRRFKTGYGCAASARPSRGFLDDTNTATRHRRGQRSDAAAVRRVRADRRAAGHHLAGAALAAETRRVPPDAVAAGQPAARRSGRCWL